MRVAGEQGWAQAEAALENDCPEDTFPASVLALEAGDAGHVSTPSSSVPKESPDIVKGLVSALGWVDPRYLTGLVKVLLADKAPLRQALGTAACDVHRRDPGSLLERLITSPSSTVRARAIRTAGDLGRRDALPLLLEALGDAKREPRYWAARSGVLLGDRQRALEYLTDCAMKPGPRQLASFTLALQALDLGRGQELLQGATSPAGRDRLRVIGAGITGNTHYVPWLIEQMATLDLARIAGEAFVRITGADFDQAQLEAMPAEDFEEGPTEDPDSEDVDVPEDIALPWPNSRKVGEWWTVNRSRFAENVRYFMGAAVAGEHCANVLKTGSQRLRIQAAHYLSLLAPGTPLFNTSAPAPRQRALLAAVGQEEPRG